jgi:hypothetical protein
MIGNIECVARNKNNDRGLRRDVAGGQNVDHTVKLEFF